MRISFELAAEFRDGQGKGASRRLRHAGLVPAILYGGHAEPRAISLNHQKLMTLVDNEKFYSSIINLVVGDKKQAAIVKDLQMHPARNAIVHQGRLDPGIHLLNKPYTQQDLARKVRELLDARP